MELPERVEEPRMTKVNILWLTLLIAGNIAVFFMWTNTPSSAEAAKQSPVLTAPSLRLLSELSEEERDQLSTSAPSASDLSQSATDPTPAATNDDSMVCRVWGPFGDRTQLEPLQRQLAELGGAIEVRQSEVQGEPDYLVFIDTGNNLDTARRTLQELETQSVDAYIIAGGPYINSVSVGVFSRENRANAQKQRVESLGYKSAVQVLSRSQTVYHLIARIPERLDQLENAGADCQTIASIQ